MNALKIVTNTTPRMQRLNLLIDAPKIWPQGIAARLNADMQRACGDLTEKRAGQCWSIGLRDRKDHREVVYRA
jgi:hypothetical protein